MQNNKENTAFSEHESSDTLNIRAELEKYLFHWKWFVLGFIISVIGAYFFLRYSTPQYSAASTIMIKDNKQSGISKELAAFEDLGIVGGSANNTDNEIQILKSRKIIGSVVDTLNLTTLYFKEGRIKRSELYRNTPIKVVFEDTYIEVTKKMRDTSFAIHIASASEFELKDMEDNFISAHHFNEEIPSNLGSFKVEKNLDFNFKEETEIYVTILKRNQVIDYYKSVVNINATDKNSSVLNLSFTHPIKEKAEDFLNELVQQYNRDAIKDKNEVSQKNENIY